jgi:hypothetical protein
MSSVSRSSSSADVRRDIVAEAVLTRTWSCGWAAGMMGLVRGANILGGVMGEAAGLKVRI